MFKKASEPCKIWRKAAESAGTVPLLNHKKPVKSIANGEDMKNAMQYNTRHSLLKSLKPSPFTSRSSKDSVLDSIFKSPARKRTGDSLRSSESSLICTLKYV